MSSCLVRYVKNFPVHIYGGNMSVVRRSKICSFVYKLSLLQLVPHVRNTLNNFFLLKSIRILQPRLGPKVFAVFSPCFCKAVKIVNALYISTHAVTVRLQLSLINSDCGQVGELKFLEYQDLIGRSRRYHLQVQCSNI